MTEFPREAQTHRLTRRPARATAAAGLAACALLLGACTSSGNHGANSTGSTSPSGSAPMTGSGAPSSGATSSGGTGGTGANNSPSTLPGNSNALIYHGVSKSQADRIQQQVAGVSGVSQVLYYSDSKVLEVDMTKQATKLDRTAVKNLVSSNMAKK